LFSLKIGFSFTFAKAYPTYDLQNAKYIIGLGNACSAALRLPSSAVLSTGLEKRGTMAVASGGFTDVWRGGLGDLRVAIKAFRIYPAQNLKEAKEVSKHPTYKSPYKRHSQILWKRVPVWMRLSHPNILPFRGVNMTLFQLSLVYEWGQNGNITQYISKNPRASRPLLVRRLLSPWQSEMFTASFLCTRRVLVVWSSKGAGVSSQSGNSTR
jgi:hypothetical protein